jgi:hypothetical protein
LCLLALLSLIGRPAFGIQYQRFYFSKLEAEP